MEKLEGTVENIIFQSEDKQFSVFRIQCASLGLVTVVYKGPAHFMGETVPACAFWPAVQYYQLPAAQAEFGGRDGTVFGQRSGKGHR